MESRNRFNFAPVALLGKLAPAIKRKSSLFIFVCSITVSAAYVLMEIAFNIQLLDVAGGKADLDEIHEVEMLGRILSSIGFGLLVGRWMYGRAFKRSVSAPGCFFKGVLGFLFAAIIFGFTQKAAVEWYSHSTPMEDRIDAYLMLTLKQGVVHNRIQLTGFEYVNQNLERAESKTLLALMGPLLYANGDFRKRIRTDWPEHVAQIAHDRSRETAPELYNAYVAASNSRGDLYELYRKVSTTMTKKTNQKIGEAYDEIARDYNRRFRRGVKRESSAGVRYYREVERHVWLKTGVRLPPKPWTIPDRAGFVRHMQRSLLTPEQLNSEINKQLKNNGSEYSDRAFRFTVHSKKTGTQVNFGWGPKAFLASRYLNVNLAHHLMSNAGAELALIRNADPSAGLSDRPIPVQTLSLPWEMGYQRFASATQDIYTANMLSIAKHEISSIRTAFSESRNPSYGARYVEALWVPPVALALSLIMLLLNLISLANSLIARRFAHSDRAGVRGAGAILTTVTSLALITAVVVLPYQSEHAIGKSPAYANLLEQVQHHTPAGGYVIDWTMRMQPMIEPIVREAIHQSNATLTTVLDALSTSTGPRT